MKRDLRFRLSLWLIGVASGILLIAGGVLMAETHYHFNMFQVQYGADLSLPGLFEHLEQALLQSMLWTLFGSVILTIMISLYIAKLLSAPLVEMKLTAEQMAKGNLAVRTRIKGNDELAELGKALNELAVQLNRQEQLREAMTQDIAHELRTPLATLKSHIQALLDRIWEPTPSRLQACYDETQRLIALVSDLEQLTALESPYFQLECKPEPLALLIRQSSDIATASFMKKNVRLTVQCPPSIVLSTDRDRFIQILVNLLSNSLKFTPEGGVVEIRAKEDDQAIVIAVHDTGAGIASEDLPYIFERLYRGDKSRNRKSGGSGIGLAIVKKLVEAHGGTVRVESVQGQGTTFYLQFLKQGRSNSMP
ncbi:sensor histidine kinase [Ferviditalea candida]|uniref:histidine kinase n=1 Tax=Ferviditalea candida TaxID=3108399 RepID=A0ABU5ZEX3_9BACL|nr:HAMP domain-containing sensor histidine kinase [Paenibacillaceae bacterium T2]